MSKPRLHIVTTVPQSLATLLAGQASYLSRFFEVTLISSPGPELTSSGVREGVATRAVEMTRQITPGQDARAIRQLYRIFLATRPAIVQTYTPKAGLLGTIAGALAGVPHRVHGIVGMPLMEANGVRRPVLAATERLTYAAATALTCNSSGLREWIGTNLSRRDIRVIGHGSINGVDTEWFSPYSPQRRQELRRRLGYADSDVVFVFIGRLVPDKGIAELVDAFVQVHRRSPKARLLVVGTTEADLTPLPSAVLAALEGHPGIRQLGWTDNVREIYGVADALVLPSYREGLPNTLLEAAAMGLPAVASNINGCNEVILHGRTGLLVAPRDSRALATAMAELCELPDRQAWGLAARDHVRREFDHVEFCSLLAAYYAELLLPMSRRESAPVLARAAGSSQRHPR